MTAPAPRRHVAHYIGLYPLPDRELTVIRRVILDYPDGLGPPQSLTLPALAAAGSPHEFRYAGGGSVAEVAQAYGVTTVTAARWLRLTEEYDQAGARRS